MPRTMSRLRDGNQFPVEIRMGTYDRINRNLKLAVVASSSSFTEHDGVEEWTPSARLREHNQGQEAARRSRCAASSTITQQLAKNLFCPSQLPAQGQGLVLTYMIEHVMTKGASSSCT